MSCPELETTSALFDGALDADAMRAARAHAEACGECTAFLAHSASLRAALGSMTWSRASAARFPRARVLLAAAVVILVALWLAPRFEPRERSAAFADFDAGRAPVVYVVPRGGR